MSDSPLIIPDAAARFFNNDLECLHKASIPRKQRRWHVKRVEDFIKAQNGHKIKTLSEDDIARYFEMMGRQNPPGLAISPVHRCYTDSLLRAAGDARRAGCAAGCHGTVLAMSSTVWYRCRVRSVWR